MRCSGIGNEHRLWYGILFIYKCGKTTGYTAGKYAGIGRSTSQLLHGLGYLIEDILEVKGALDIRTLNVE